MIFWHESSIFWCDELKNKYIWQRISLELNNIKKYIKIIILKVVMWLYKKYRLLR